jgi:hypothetical protein
MTPEEHRKAALDEFKLLYKHGEKFGAEIMVKCFIWCEKYQNDIEAALSAPAVQPDLEAEAFVNRTIHNFTRFPNEIENSPQQKKTLELWLRIQEIVKKHNGS